MNNNNQNHKYIALDSLRGIAALMVIFQHFWEMNNPSDARLKPWLFFCAGHEAVILFFVLSGFVLVHQLRNYWLSNYGEFLVRRIFRIYPAYYVSLILSAGLLYGFQNYYPSSLDGFGLTRWFYIWSSTSFDKSLVINTLFLITHNGNSLNVAVWSLFFEMWISIVFPFIIFGLWKSGVVIRLICIAALLFVSWRLFQYGQWIDNQWEAISYYLWYFILGAVLYYSHDRIKQVSGLFSLLVGLGLYFINYLLFGRIANRMYHEMIISLGCFLILLNGIHYKYLQRFLLNALWQFYGKISYSLYLFHLPVLYALSYWLLHKYKYDLVIIKILTLTLATFLAWICYNMIELKGVRLVKRLIK